MNDARKEFRDRLVEMEQTTPSLKERYQKETKAMFEKKLTRPMKLAWIGTGILGMGFVVLFGTTAIMAPKELPMLARSMFVAGAVFGLAWAVLAALIVKRGAMSLKSHGKALVGMTWCFLVLLTTLTLLLASQHPDRIVGVHMICAVLPFLIMGAVFMIQYRIQEAELNTREKLLEIELRMTDLAEKLEGKE